LRLIALLRVLRLFGYFINSDCAARAILGEFRLDSRLS
jgi:hypothetical protein